MGVLQGEGMGCVPHGSPVSGAEPSKETQAERTSLNCQDTQPLITLDKQGRGRAGLGVVRQHQPSRHWVRPCCHYPATQPRLPWLGVSTRDHHRGHLRVGTRDCPRSCISTNGRRPCPSGERFRPPGVGGAEGLGPPGCPTLGEGERTEGLMPLTWPQPLPEPLLASWLRGGSHCLTWNVAHFSSPELLRGPKPGTFCPGPLPSSICKGSQRRFCREGAAHQGLSTLTKPGDPGALGQREGLQRAKSTWGQISVPDNGQEEEVGAREQKGSIRGMTEFKDVGKILECLEDPRMLRTH